MPIIKFSIAQLGVGVDVMTTREGILLLPGLKLYSS